VERHQIAANTAHWIASRDHDNADRAAQVRDIASHLVLAARGLSTGLEAPATESVAAPRIIRL
jgi:hypothetical protein